MLQLVLDGALQDISADVASVSDISELSDVSETPDAPAEPDAQEEMTGIYVQQAYKRARLQ